MNKKSKDFKFDFLILIAFFTSVIFIFATYAWFSSTLNVDLNLMKIKVNTESDFSFSLDGINWSKTLIISKKTIIDDIENLYPTNTNNWSPGLATISSPGLKYSNDYLAFFNGYSFRKKRVDGKNIILFNSEYDSDNGRNTNSNYIAFDLFFRNKTRSQNIYSIFLQNTSKFVDVSKNDNVSQNAVRLGMVLSDRIPANSEVSIIQQLKCQANCKAVIFEPNSTSHLEKSIKQAKNSGIIIEDGKKYPTYALNESGDKIELYEGLYNSGYNINQNYFKEQKTMTDFNEPITEIRNEIIKIRMYIWIEGQDIDLFAMTSDGYTLEINLDFTKHH